MADILILRFSAIGDVAMTVPAVDSLARRYPADRYTVVSRSFLAPLFARCPANVRFVGVDPERDYKGIRGMYRLYRELSAQKFDVVADLHDVLRTKLLRLFFRFGGVKVKYIDKGRKEKRRLTRKKNKIFRPLKPAAERYADVFRASGRPVELDFWSVFGASCGDFALIESITGAKTGAWVGIAPFAKHAGKILPIERIEEIAEYFSRKPGVKVFLFGGGAEEKEITERLVGKYRPQTISIVGKLNIAGELVLMSYLDVMLSMDSANMHLASLTATPAVSVWGATHPYAGFYGYRQPPEHAVQVPLFCRPCSVYGNKPCYRKEPACLLQITSQTIIDKMEKIIGER